MAQGKDRQITIRFEQGLFDQLRRCAEADDRSVASLVRQLARQHVRAAEVGVQGISDEASRDTSR